MSIETPDARRLKVLFLIDSLQGGGAERSLAEMLPGLERRGIDPIVVCLRRSAEGVEGQVRGRFDLRYLDARRFPGRTRAVRSIIRTERPDLVHTTLLQSDLIGRLAAVGTPVRVLTSLVNTSYDPVRFEDPRIRPWVFRMVQRVDGLTARRLTAHFHAITSAVKDHNVQALRLAPSRVTVIERGRDGARLGEPTEARRRAARRSLDLPEDAEVVVTLGRQEYQKGQRYLLEAVERLARHRPRLVLLMLGRRGAASPELDELLRRQLIAERVRVLGHRDDAPDILAAADLFVFPSLFEGLGGSLIEAMALGLPIVASDLPAVREVLEHGNEGNATLVPPGRTEPLADAIDDLLSNPGKARLFGARSRRIYEERFTLDRSIDRMAGLYRALVADRSYASTNLTAARPTPAQRNEG
jgi:glycosyltransferase involved in cell wall biosynthesis